MYVLLLAEGFEEVEAVTPVDFLRRAGVEVCVAAIGAARLVKGTHGIPVLADRLIGELPKDVEGVILPGGGGGADNLAASPAALDLIRRCFTQGKLVAAICAAPAVVLGAAGVLSGRRATGYPGYEDRLEAAGARVLSDRVVVDGNLITSRGPGTAAEFAIALIETIVGAGKAREVHQGTLQKG